MNASEYESNANECEWDANGGVSTSEYESNGRSENEVEWGSSECERVSVNECEWDACDRV